MVVGDRAENLVCHLSTLLIGFPSTSFVLLPNSVAESSASSRILVAVRQRAHRRNPDHRFWLAANVQRQGPGDKLSSPGLILQVLRTGSVIGPLSSRSSATGSEPFIFSLLRYNQLSSTTPPFLAFQRGDRPPRTFPRLSYPPDLESAGARTQYPISPTFSWR